MAHLDEHKLLSDKQHEPRKWHRCGTHLTTVIPGNQGQVVTFILDFEKALIQPHINSVTANCLATELVVRH